MKVTLTLRLFQPVERQFRIAGWTLTLWRLSKQYELALMQDIRKRWSMRFWL